MYVWFLKFHWMISSLYDAARLIFLQFWVFSMVGIVFSSSFYWYYIYGSKMYITHITHNSKTLYIHEDSKIQGWVSNLKSFFSKLRKTWNRCQEIRWRLDVIRWLKTWNKARNVYTFRVLIVLGELYSQTGNPTNATSYILDCITTAKKHYLEHLTALGCLHLAFIQVYSYVMKTRLGQQYLFSYISLRLFCNIINAIYGHKTLLVHTEIAESWFEKILKITISV